MCTSILSRSRSRSLVGVRALSLILYLIRGYDDFVVAEFTSAGLALADAITSVAPLAGADESLAEFAQVFGKAFKTIAFLQKRMVRLESVSRLCSSLSRAFHVLSACSLHSCISLGAISRNR